MTAPARLARWTGDSAPSCTGLSNCDWSKLMLASCATKSVSSAEAMLYATCLRSALMRICSARRSLSRVTKPRKRRCTISAA
eukprot:733064-Pleurochrysis_carterae.AAC.4